MEKLNNNSNSHFTYKEEENLDLRRLISMFVSNWYWFATSIFIAVILAYGINRYSEKVYTVSSTLLIRDDQAGGVLTSSVESVIPGGDIFKKQQNLKNEIGILRSMSLNTIVINSLKDFNVTYVAVGRRGIVESRLYKSCPFIVEYDSLYDQNFQKKLEIILISQDEYNIKVDDEENSKRIMHFGEKYKTNDFDFTIQRRYNGQLNIDNDKSNKYYFWFEEAGQLANVYRNKLVIEPIEKDASVVTISTSGFVPQQESDYLNKLMQVYINYGLDLKNEIASKTIDFIDEQLIIISDSLSRAEKNLERYRLENNFFDLSREGSLIQEKLKNFEETKSSFELQLQYYNYLSDYLNKDQQETIVSPTVMGISDQVLIRLVNDLSSLQYEKERIGYNMIADQPLIDYLNDRLSEKKEAIKENISNGISTLNNSIQAENAKIESLQKEIRKLPTTERNLIGIQRKFELNNSVYTYLLEKNAEAGIAKASNVSDNHIVDYASSYSTTIIKPKRELNIVVSIVLGLLIPAVLILLIDFFNDKIIDKKDIEKKTSIPIIGYISHNEKRHTIPVIAKPGSAFAESFRSIRTSLKYFINENNKPVIAVTSTISSEGKTFVSLNLAAIIAMLGKKVLLIGLDMRKPKLNNLLNFSNVIGMSNFLSGEVLFEDIIKPTQVENLYYAPSGPVPPNPAELLERDKMGTFIQSAKQEFDYIIIDTPPVAVVTDTMLIAQYVNLNLFILRQRYTSRATLEIIDQIHKREELRNVALILNDINLSGYYGYGIRYGYSLGYGYYYGHNYYGKGYYSRLGRSSKAEDYYLED
jgi:capsular exopolysaccharide synthesis family protein